MYSIPYISPKKIAQKIKNRENILVKLDIKIPKANIAPSINADFLDPNNCKSLGPKGIIIAEHVVIIG